MEVLGVQEFGLPILEPLSPGQRLAFGTVAIGTGVVSVALMAAPITLLQVTAENSSPADLYRSHDTALRHRHQSAVLQTIIFITEPHLALGDVQQTIVRDRYAMSIAPDVVQDLLGSSERPLGVDHPFSLAQGSQVI